MKIEGKRRKKEKKKGKSEERDDSAIEEEFKGIMGAGEIGTEEGISMTRTEYTL